MLSLEQARQLLGASLASIRPQVQWLSLAEAQGGWLAEPLHARFALPPLANSAMDGFAIVSADASADADVVLSVQGQVLADGAPARSLQAGQAMRITTGAPLPHGADAVVIQENCHLQGEQLSFRGPVRAGAHVRQAGEDFRQGDPVLPAGCRLGPIELALAASFGAAQLRVLAPPRVAIISTGDELLQPGQPRAGSAIYDSNGSMLAALVHAAGGVALPPLHVGDDPELIAQALQRCAAAADLVISCGGASVGAADHLPQILARDGHLHFWKLRIKPGMPVLYASMQDTPVLALPGNPVSALVTFLLLGRFAIRLLAGVDPADPPALQGRLLAGVRKTHARREFQRCSVRNVDGQLLVQAGPAQGSHHLSGVRDADALLDLPEGEQDWPAGSLMRVYLLREWMHG